MYPIKHLFCIVVYLSTLIQATAQYVSENPVFSSRESKSLTLKKATVYPDKIWLECDYINFGSDPQMQISNQTSIRLPPFSNQTYLVTNRRNISSTMTSIPSGKTVTFSVGFRVPLFKLIDEDLKKKEHSLEFYQNGELTLDFLDCSDEYRRANNVAYGNCWNYYGVLVKLDIASWNALYCYGYLESQIQKDEFETSSEFAARITPQALTKLLKDKILYFDEICKQAYIFSLIDQKPGLVYNADEQEFTISYKGANPAKIKMSPSEARTFKEGIMNETIKLIFGDIEKNMTGNYVFENFYFKKGSEKMTYKNSQTNSEEMIRFSFRNYRAIQDIVKSLQRENGAKAELD